MPDLSIPNLRKWLIDRLDGVSDVAIGEPETPKSGYSAETIIFPAEITRKSAPSEAVSPPAGSPRAGSPRTGSQRARQTEQNNPEVSKFVLRRETPEQPVYPAQNPDIEVEISIQYRAMEAVTAATDVPIAPLHGYESDPEVLGAPFFVMGYVPGEVPVEDPNYTLSGFFHDARPAQRNALLRAGIETMADIHRIDWQTADFDWLVPEGITPGTSYQLRLWEKAAEEALDGRSLPILERGFQWLRENLPEDSPLGVGWGDARPGNIIWQNFAPACVTDFEAAAIVPPEFDLGWWLMFDRWSHDHIGGPRLEGEPSLEQQRDHYLAYAQSSGGYSSIPETNIFYQEVFAAARYAAIVVRVMNRSVTRGELPADNDFWRENPVVDCLDSLLPD